MFENKDIEAVGNWMQPMTTAEKADKVFQSGLDFKIWNRPVQYYQIWDIRIFWTHVIGEVPKEHECPEKGFKDLDECLDDILIYIEKHNDKI